MSSMKPTNPWIESGIVMSEADKLEELIQLKLEQPGMTRETALKWALEMKQIYGASERPEHAGSSLNSDKLYEWCEANVPESIRSATLACFLGKFIGHINSQIISQPNKHKAALQDLLDNSAVITPPAYDDVFVHLEVRTEDYNKAYDSLLP